MRHRAIGAHRRGRNPAPVRLSIVRGPRGLVATRREDVIMGGLRLLALAVFVLGLTGCGGDGLKRVKVKGKITAKGQPVDKAALVFLPLGSTQGLGGIGGSDASGNFTVMSAASTTHK